MTDRIVPRQVADPWGFAAAALSGLHMFDVLGRSTGRTTMLVDMAGPSDTIVCASRTYGRHVERLLRQAGKDRTRVVVVPPERAFELMHREDLKGRRGRLLFEHDFVRELVENAIRRVSGDLDTMAKALSNPRADWPMPTGNAHRAEMALEEWSAR